MGADGALNAKCRLQNAELKAADLKIADLKIGVATAGGVVFIGATNDRRFRAFDAKTGKELWVTKLDNSAIADPMTYQAKGKQYVAITSASGGGITDPDPNKNESLYVFSLP